MVWMGWLPVPNGVWLTHADIIAAGGKFSYHCVVQGYAYFVLRLMTHDLPEGAQAPKLASESFTMKHMKPTKLRFSDQ